MKSVIDRARQLTEPVPKLPEKQEEKKQSVETTISELLYRLGGPAHLKGYRFLREAVLLAVKDMNILDAVTTQLYPAVAVKFDSTMMRVERNIRTAIEMSWDRGDPKIYEELFGYKVTKAMGKTTNSEFVALLADTIYLELNKRD